MSIAIAVIGAQKSGTSTIMKLLATDARLHVPARETSYFLSHAEQARGMAHARAKYWPKWNGEKPLAIKSSVLMFNRQGMSALSAAAPDAKIAVVLRNPVDRAISAYYYGRSMGWENRPIEAAIFDEEQAPLLDEISAQNLNYLTNGNYSSALENNVFPVFGRSNVTTMFFEDLAHLDRIGKSIAELGAAVELGGEETAPRVNERRDVRYQRFAVRWSELGRFRRRVYRYLPQHAVNLIQEHLSVTKLNRKYGAAPAVDPNEARVRARLTEVYAHECSAIAKLLGKRPPW